MTDARKRHGRAIRTLLAIYRVDSIQKAVGRFGPPLIGVALFAYFLPQEFAAHWGKVAFGALAYLIFMPIMYIWTYRTLPDDAVPITGLLSPFYDPAVRKKFKVREFAQNQEIDRLKSSSRAYQELMDRTDLTTDQGQQEYRRISKAKQELDAQVAELEKEPKLRLGFLAD